MLGFGVQRLRFGPLLIDECEDCGGGRAATKSWVELSVRPVRFMSVLCCSEDPDK